MNLPFWGLLAALTTWRLSSLLARERGLFGIFTFLRDVLGIDHQPDGTPFWDEAGEIGLHALTPWSELDALVWELARGVVCVWCNSIWIGALVALAVGQIMPVLIEAWPNYLLTVFALSAGAIFCDRAISED